MTRELLVRRLEAEQLASGREAHSLARWVWEDVMGKSTQDRIAPDDADNEKLDSTLARLKRGEPVQYIAGHAWFYGLKLRVSPAVLIPRPESEELVAWILEDIARAKTSPVRILDIGTGSGCIIIALGKKLGHLAELVAVDISADALTLARVNAAIHDVIVGFHQHDFLENGFQGLGNFDVIVSNPPYISQALAGEEVVSKLSFEPDLALYPPGEDPDIFYKKIIDEAGQYLKSSGACYLELNEFRAEKVCEYAKLSGWSGVELRQDLQGAPRMLKLVP